MTAKRWLSIVIPAGLLFGLALGWLTAGAQTLTDMVQGRPSQNRDAQYIVIYGHSVVDPTQSYAVYCPDVHPSCNSNTVYRTQVDYTGFTTLDDALSFLSDHQEFELIRVVKATDVPVSATKKKKTEHHPDTESTEKVYSK